MGTLNTIHSTPLHGVECSDQIRNCNAKKLNSVPYGLQVTYEQILAPSDILPIWSLQDKGEHYSTQLDIYDLANNGLILEVNCEGAGRFHITQQKIAIDWQAGGTDAEHYFQTLAIALWLELQGVACIHANAMVKNNVCIALVAPSGMGKSTLSAYLQSQGFSWLTDDMLALHPKINKQGVLQFCAYPSWPKARMWPDTVQAVTQQQVNALNRVHARFNKVELPINPVSPTQSFTLGGIYVLNRRAAGLASLKQNARLMADNGEDYLLDSVETVNQRNDASITKVNSSLALMAILQNSMLGNAYSRLGLEQARLKVLSGVVNSVAIKQINYASNFESLEQIYRLIKKDLKV